MDRNNYVWGMIYVGVQPKAAAETVEIFFVDIFAR